jgi:hypothetical protein
MAKEKNMPNSYEYNAAIGSLIFLIIIGSAVFIALYVLSAVALYRMAVNRGMKSRAFLAWIPVGSSYLFGLLSRENSLSYMHILLPACDLVTALLYLTFRSQTLYIVVMLIQLPMQLYALYGLLKCYDTEWSAGKHVALSLFIPLYRVILLFLLRDRPPVAPDDEETDVAKARLESLQDFKARHWRKF